MALQFRVEFSLFVPAVGVDSHLDVCLTKLADHEYFECHDGQCDNPVFAAKLGEWPHFGRHGDPPLPQLQRAKRDWLRSAPIQAREVCFGFLLCFGFRSCWFGFWSRWFCFVKAQRVAGNTAGICVVSRPRFRVCLCFVVLFGAGLVAQDARFRQRRFCRFCLNVLVGEAVAQACAGVEF